MNYYCTPVTKERLRDHRKLVIEIARQEERLERLEARSEYTATKYAPVTTRGAGNSDKLTDYVIEKESLAAQYISNQTKLMADAAELTQAIGELTDTKERLALTLYYIDGLLWREVAEKMSYSSDWVLEFHNRALKKLLEITKEPGSSQ